MNGVTPCIDRHIVSGRGKLHVRGRRTTERGACVGHTSTLCARYVTDRHRIQALYIYGRFPGHLALATST